MLDVTVAPLPDIDVLDPSEVLPFTASSKSCRPEADLLTETLNTKSVYVPGIALKVTDDALVPNTCEAISCLDDGIIPRFLKYSVECNCGANWKVSSSCFSNSDRCYGSGITP